MPTTVTNGPPTTTTDAAGNTVTSYTTTVTIPPPAVVVPPPVVVTPPPVQPSGAPSVMSTGLLAKLNGFNPAAIVPALCQDISGLPVNAALQAAYRAEYCTPDGNHMHIDTTVPYVVINVKPSVKFSTITDIDDSDNVPFPLDPTWPATWFEGGGKITAQPSGDRHVLLLNLYDNQIYEIYQAVYSAKMGWSCYACRVWPMTKAAVLTAGRNSVDAAGLPVMPFILRYEEVASGVINHALRFTTNSSNKQYIPPACHSAGGGDAAYMGLRFRLPASYDISGFSKANQVILTALKKYGGFVADNGSTFMFTADSSPNWNQDDLQNLGAITDKIMEVVNTGNPVTPPA